MPAELLQHGIVKVARVAQEATGDVVRVLHAAKYLIDERDGRPLAEFKLPRLGLYVQLVDPAVVSGSLAMLHMVLELDNVAVGNVFGIDRLDERSFGNRPGAEDGRRSSADGEAQQSTCLHDDDDDGSGQTKRMWKGRE
jgi:hypothetical protein